MKLEAQFIRIVFRPLSMDRREVITVRDIFIWHISLLKWIREISMLKMVLFGYITMFNFEYIQTLMLKMQNHDFMKHFMHQNSPICSNLGHLGGPII